MNIVMTTVNLYRKWQWKPIEFSLDINMKLFEILCINYETPRMTLKIEGVDVNICIWWM